MAEFDFFLYAAAVLAPGLSSLAQLRAIASGAEAYAHAPLALPAPAMLPAQERRRASQAVRLVLACIEQALQGSPFPAATLRPVFAADEGTGEVSVQMLEALATTRQVSPLVFSNSVLNAPSGYFSIAWGNREPATVVSLGLESFASGLLCAVVEARATGAPVLLVNYDPVMTAPMNEQLPIADAMASAWVIGCGPSEVSALASFSVALDARGDAQASALPDWMPAPWSQQASAAGVAALALLESPAGTQRRLPLGAQMLTLRRQEIPA
ncbi:beta-ketoacyl synthase chain length factor [Ramlibacter sp. PS4R-6]|uniref:beta-ketoacyl synthase chain length factor n=1 Tax=Ramlibacter sp. PS4R-6 TaxID=3133438 RepID=UPI0030A164CD